MEIRPAQLEDYDAVSEIFEQSTLLHDNLEPGWIKKDRPKGIKREDYNNFIKGEDTIILVAVSNGDIEGFVKFNIKTDDENDYFHKKEYVMIHDIAIREDKRGSGIGTKLMEATEDWARARKIYDVELSTRTANNDALEFYKHLGYEDYMVRSRKHLKQDTSEN